MTSPCSLSDITTLKERARPKTKKFVLCPNAICLKIATEMSRNPKRTKKNPEMVIKESFDRARNLFSKTFRNIKSFLIGGCIKIPKQPVFSNKLNSKLEKLENFYRSFSQHWESNEVEEKKEFQFSPEEQTQTDEECSKSSLTVGLELREEKKGVQYSGRFKEEPSFRDSYALAQKMKELEMMDVNDIDHVLDVEEVIHYYSRLTCPAYLDIVDKFFKDMYSGFQIPQPSRRVNGSMRKMGSARLGSTSVHSSMRNLGPIKI